jgi:hypothetical protein
MKHIDKLIQFLYTGSALSLAAFCLIQSNRMSHDQKARDLATKSIHMDVSPKMPFSTQPSLDFHRKQIGEKSDQHLNSAGALGT